MSQKQQPEIVFRCIGFKEIWDLLDLDKYDEILLEDMKRTDERIQQWFIELYRVDPQKPIDSRNPEHPEPVLVPNNLGSIGKSLGKMPVDAARQKFL